MAAIGARRTGPSRSTRSSSTSAISPSQVSSFTPPAEPRKTEQIAVIGAGPAGLSCAYQLARPELSRHGVRGVQPTGGMLRYGIPKYRLPREVLDGEINRILDWALS